MARNNHVRLRGNVTGEIYYKVMEDSSGMPNPFLSFYLMTNPENGVRELRGARVVVYGALAEYAHAHIKPSSKVGVDGHLQIRTHPRTGERIFETVATDVEFIQHIDWTRGRAKHVEMFGSATKTDGGTPIVFPFDVPVYYTNSELSLPED